MQFYSAPLCYVTACDKCPVPPRLMTFRGRLIRLASSSWQLSYFCSFLCNIVSKVTWLHTPQRSPLLQNTISVLLADESRVIPCGERNLQKGVMALQHADDGNIPHGAKHNRHHHSLPAPASHDIFRSTSQGQRLGVAAWTFGYFAAFCFGVCFFFWQMSTASLSLWTHTRMLAWST